MARRSSSDSVPMDIPMTGLLHKVALMTRHRMAKHLAEEEWFAKENFRPPCIGVIHAIARTPPVSQKEISEWMGLDPSDLVGIIDQLESAGYVTRTRDPLDRRRQLLALTPKGVEARKKLTKVGMKATEEVLSPLNAKERELLHSLLARVVYGNLNKEEK